MEEVILLYNIHSLDKDNIIKGICEEMGLIWKEITPDQYKTPIGFLAYGSTEQQKEFLIDGEHMPAFEIPMMILAGMTGARMKSLLVSMKEKNAPYIGLKAMLTEYNAVWDSMYLHEELTKEHEYMKGI